MAFILIVDDDWDVLNTLKRELTRKGHQVICTSNAYDALKNISHSYPDLVLLDIAIPGIDGIELCRRIRSNPQTASIPILFVTVSDEIDAKVSAFDAGADDYLVKPFDLQELDLRVHVLLSRKSMRKSN